MVREHNFVGDEVYVMKLVIFGATGSTGQYLVQGALAAGHDVVAFARNPGKLNIQNHKQLICVQGDIQDAAKVVEAIAGVDAVLSVLGPTRDAPPFAITTGTQNILSAMQQQDVRRLVISAGAGVRDPLDKPKLIDHVFGLLLRVLSRSAVEDMTQVVKLVRASDLDWTVVRVPRLLDTPGSGKIRIGYLGADVSTQLSRADMAAFMLQQVTDRTYLHQAPVISN
jgi:putative NADH-flavin reductase